MTKGSETLGVALTLSVTGQDSKSLNFEKLPTTFFLRGENVLNMWVLPGVPVAEKGLRT